MAGAFTGVANDASASWWNPAGLAGGPYFEVLLEYARQPDADARHRGVAVAFPALGVSYYRLTVSEIQPTNSTAGSGAGRQDQGTPLVRSLELSQFGVTVGQSVGEHLVIGSTFKLLRGAADTEAGLDIGAMATFGIAKAGVIVRNVREPSFGEGDAAMTLRRQVRAGAALTASPRGSFGGATVAFDADLRRVATATGDERRVAAGAEVWAVRRVVGVRAGVSTSTVGARRTAQSAGLSLAVRRGIYLDGQLTGGDDLRRGWTAAMRLTF